MLQAIRQLAAHRTSEGEYYLGLALLKQDPPETAEALVHLNRAAAMDVKGTRALIELARQHTIAARNSAAVHALREALRRDDTLAVAHYRLGQLYRAAGRKQLSQQHLQRYRELQ
ncbi:MAG: hypothetical protein WKF37_11690 [Bryobacteraceae bacterium]